GMPSATADYSVMVRSFAATQARTDNFIELIPASVGPANYRVHLTYAPEDMAVLQAMRNELEHLRTSLGADPAEVQTMPPGASHHESGCLVAGDNPATSVVDGCGS